MALERKGSARDHAPGEDHRSNNLRSPLGRFMDQEMKRETLEEFIARGGQVEKLVCLYGQDDPSVQKPWNTVNDAAKFSQWKKGNKTRAARKPMPATRKKAK